MKISRIGISILTVLCTVTTVGAQDRKTLPQNEMNKYVVSAKAGVVNMIEGDATVAHAMPFAVPDAPTTLISGDELKSGDVVNTGPNSRVEILLNPGCYLRLGEKSEFVFLFDNFITDKLKLVRGSAVLEATAIDNPISVETPKSTFQITRDGLYRFNIEPDGKVDLAVRKGRAVVGETTIKEGKRAVVEDGTAAIAKLDKKATDELDGWSKERAKSLVAANSRLSYSGIRRTLTRSLMSNAWIYDPLYRCYTFLPLFDGFFSPYGWNYTVFNPYYAYYSYPRRYNNGGYNSGSGTYNGGSHSGGSNTTGGSRSGGGSTTGGGSRSGGGSTIGGGSSGGSNGGGMRMPSPSFGGGADRGAAKGSAGTSRGRAN